MPGDLGEVRPVELPDRAHHRVARPASPPRRRAPATTTDQVASPSSHVRERTSVREADVVEEPVVAARSRGSSRGGLPGSSSAAASRDAARTSSCSCGWGCRPGTPDRCSRTRCRRRRRSSRPPVNSMPACWSRCAVSSPDIPAPITTTRKSRSGSTSSFAPLRAPPVVAAERELLVEQRDVVVHVGAADRVLHDAQQVVAATAGARHGNRRRGSGSSALERERSRAAACCAALMPPCGEGEQVRVGSRDRRAGATGRR